jgi:hypothetical protein
MKFGGTLISGAPYVTVDELITVLCQFPPDRRVVVPGQEWGLADVGDISSRRLAFSYSGDEDMGCWIPHLLRRPDMPREQCVVIHPQPSSRRRRSASNASSRRSVQGNDNNSNR